jgi:hypothetical protein
MQSEACIYNDQSMAESTPSVTVADWHQKADSILLNLSTFQSDQIVTSCHQMSLSDGSSDKKKY